ncbi:MAG TPA: substrate-binding domain-containing protein [Bacillota bacterium]|nr:substrate-binding domain-containing protein [Bacillota bacterium]HOL08870.1 substrate-binding domain-containing protein [Bacillota bacterium]HPO96563.1 substrate-binding domain-containing protein [Bacillota bacterium]
MKSNRPTIALLINDFQATETPIWDGVAQTAKLLDVNLITLAGGQYRSWTRNKAYNLIDKEHIDGIICITECIGSFTSEQNMIDFLRLFEPIPIINIGPPLSGYLSMVVDNKTGMRELVEHFISVHNYRQIAYISGPANNVEAEHRLEGYKEALEAHGLDYNPDFVYYGDFWSSGPAAVQYFLDEKKIKFDALIAANDFMALGAMQELQNRGFIIPDDIGLGGFDDIHKAKSSEPSLTTVSQPFYKMGCESLKNILALIQNKEISSLTVPAHMIIRNSCGCNTDNYIVDNLANNLPFTTIKADNPQEIVEQIASHVLAQFPEINAKMKDSNWAFDLTYHYYTAISGSTAPFLNFLSQTVKQGIKNDVEIPKWYQVIRLLSLLLKNVSKDNQKERLSELRADANEILGNIIKHNKTATDSLFEEQINVLTTLILELNNSWTMGAEHLNYYKKALNRLNIQNFFLCRYENTELNQAQVTFYFSKKQIEIPNVFSTKLLIPGWFDNPDSNSAIIIPIFNIGYIFFDINISEFYVDATLFPQLTLSIRQLSLMSEILNYTSELEKKVAERTKQLVETQQQMVENAHRAGMAEISVNVMHNIGNLLNSACVASETIGSILAQSKVNGLIKANQLLTTYRNEFNNLNGNNEFPKLIDYYEILGKEIQKEHSQIISEYKLLTEKIALIHESMRSLQDFTTAVTLTEALDPAVLIDDSLRFLESLLNNNQIIVIKDYLQVQPVVFSKNKLYYILVNLIKNAVEAMYNTPVDSRYLTVKVFSDPEDNVVLQIIDTGEGINPENFTQIFNYGFTTKPGGHGFTLHTCANYMREMGGQINVTPNTSGIGTTFTLTFPPKNK